MPRGFIINSHEAVVTKVRVTLVREQLRANVKKSSGFLQESPHLVNSNIPGVFDRELWTVFIILLSVQMLLMSGNEIYFKKY